MDYKRSPINLMWFNVKTDAEYNRTNRAFCKAYNDALLESNRTNKFNRNSAEVTLYCFLQLVTVLTETKLKIQEFVAKPFTSKELYHFLESISIKYCDTPPEDDEARMIDLEWCEDQSKLSAV